MFRLVSNCFQCFVGNFNFIVLLGTFRREIRRPRLFLPRERVAPLTRGNLRIWLKSQKTFFNCQSELEKLGRFKKRNNYYSLCAKTI